MGTIFVAGPWAGFHGILFGFIALLMWFMPGEVALPRLWWVLAGLFIIAGCGVFLPAEWFGVPEWRKNLSAIGVDTGSQVVIQSQQAAENLAFFSIMLITGMWFATHRASFSQLRVWTLAFTLGVAVYAILSRIRQDLPSSGVPGHFGFFPNRNHTGTYLAMGAICGLGCIVQALRDKRFYSLAIALVATSVCMWAAAAWSISRGGIVLITVGSLLWIFMLGRRYLGKNGVWAISLLAIAAVGAFLITESRVKLRISDTLERADQISQGNELPQFSTVTADGTSFLNLDFRVPTAIDTFHLIREFPWTGIGAGQYFYIFPQYKNLTSVLNHTDSLHPESSWLWMASETGIPAILTLALLITLVFWKSLTAIKTGKDRALRAACLSAAMLVPFHSFFDVPGHKITLVFSAVLLYTFSLRPPDASEELRTPSRGLKRIVALGLSTIAIFLIVAQWWGGTQPAITMAQKARGEAIKLYQQDSILQQNATAKGESYEPEPSEDLLEKALRALDHASKYAPLDRDLLRLQSGLALQFDDKYKFVDQTFAIERALDPTWVESPLRQADSWATILPEKVLPLCQEAVRRAEQLDKIKPNTRWSVAATQERIKKLAATLPSADK